MGSLNRSLTYSLQYSRNLHNTCTKVHAKRRWGDTFNSTLAEQVDGVGVSPSRIAAHTSSWIQTLPTTHQEHLLVHRDATASLDHILQLFYTENTFINILNTIITKLTLKTNGVVYKHSNCKIICDNLFSINIPHHLT